jgi:hypothetical protein
MNSDLAEHISRLAAPIYAAMLVGSPEIPHDEAWRALAYIVAINMARELWKATLDA